MSGARRPLVAGNWKLHCTIDESVALANAVAAGLGDDTSSVDVVVAPTMLAIHPVAAAVTGGPVAVASQDTYWEDRGAFTGEVSPSLLRAAGCRLGIVGHSERRHVFRETDDDVRRKREALVAAGLVAIVCVGETLAEREAGETEAVVLRQVRAALAGLDPSAAAAGVVVAYEPVWAIGTGKNASPEDAQAVHAAIRETLRDALGGEAAAGVRILYGGSVKPANCSAIFCEPDVDGALVGGASLDAASFLAIVRAAGAAAG